MHIRGWVIRKLMKHTHYMLACTERPGLWEGLVGIVGGYPN